MEVLRVEGLTKSYTKFKLSDINLSIQSGEIRGFIGRNGAGKTTTLKCIFDLVFPDSGSVSCFGKPFKGNENELKQKIGCTFGRVNYYNRKKLKQIADVTSRFYESWDNSLYQSYLQRFNLDENKSVGELSEGMKVKFNLALALSHGAKLLVLDEPTSGLDPVSRDELLDVFLDLRAEGVAILFSTHIITDLEKCANTITYIRGGKIIADNTVEGFKKDYLLVQNYTQDMPKTLGVCRSQNGVSGLIYASEAQKFTGAELSVPDMQQIMLHLERGE